MAENDWKVINRKILLKTPFFEVWQDATELPDKTVSDFYSIRKKPYSLIIPLFGDKTILVHQYRPVVKAESWEFAAGYVKDKNPREIAEIELAEETGVSAKLFKEIGTFWQACGSSNQVGHVYVAEDLTFGKPHPEVGEFVIRKEFTIDEVRQMIENGIIRDGSSIVAFHFLEKYLQTK